MQTEHIVRLLVEERDKLNRAIDALGGTTTAKRRGRPPKNPVAASTVTPQKMSDGVKPAKVSPRRKARTWTAAQKKAAGERMAARWAAKKKATAKKAAK